MSERVSVKPSEAQAGGNFGFPAGSTVTILEASWARAEEAGEKFYSQGKATADDPTLKLVGQIEGEDDPRDPVFLRAGSAARMIPDESGEFLVKAEGSSATGLGDSCNAKVFLDSIFYKDKNSDAYKKHGKQALPESMLEDDISNALVGLKFVAGAKVVERQGLDDGGRKPRPTLVADEILEHPTGTGKVGGSSKKASSKKKVEEDDDEDEAPAPKKGKAAAGGGEKAIIAAAEKAVIAALESPKYRNGIPAQKAYVAAYKSVEGEDNEDKIMELIKDDDWMQDKKRPWTYDEDDEVYKSVE